MLTPRILYPLSVSPISPSDIDSLESLAMRYILPKLHLAPTASRLLVTSALGGGGLGWTSWRTQVTVRKAHLASHLAFHADPEMRALFQAMRFHLQESEQNGRERVGELSPLDSGKSFPPPPTPG